MAASIAGILWPANRKTQAHPSPAPGPGANCPVGQRIRVGARLCSSGSVISSEQLASATTCSQDTICEVSLFDRATVTWLAGAYIYALD